MTDYSKVYAGLNKVGGGLGKAIVAVFNTAMGNNRLNDRGIDRSYSSEFIKKYPSGRTGDNGPLAPGEVVAIYGSIFPAVVTAVATGLSVRSVSYGIVAGVLASMAVPQIQSMWVAGKYDHEQKAKSDSNKFNPQPS